MKKTLNEQMNDEWCKENSKTIDRTPELIDKLYVATEVELGVNYSLCDNTLEYVSLYGSEYEYEIELTDEIFAEIVQLSDNEFETVQEELRRDCALCIDKDNRHWLAYTTYPGTPCLTLSEDALDGILRSLSKKIKKIKTDGVDVLCWRGMHIEKILIMHKNADNAKLQRLDKKLNDMIGVRVLHSVERKTEAAVAAAESAGIRQIRKNIKNYDRRQRKLDADRQTCNRRFKTV